MFRPEPCGFCQRGCRSRSWIKISSRPCLSGLGLGRWGEDAVHGKRIRFSRGGGPRAASAVTVESLLVSLAAPRLRREGVPLGEVHRDPEDRLYALLSETAGELAHARYTACLRQISSFADACRFARRGSG